MGEGPPKHTRSRDGCTRCRRRRQKCDREKPCCGRCVAAGADCLYRMNISWGGRAFRKSPFGKYLNNVEINSSVTGDGFVYALPSSQPVREPVAEPTTEEEMESSDPSYATSESCSNSTDALIKSSHHVSEMTISPDLVANSILPVLPRSLDQIHGLPPMASHLLQFYFLETLRITVPSGYALAEICRFIFPVSLQQPCLLYAIMSFAAVHLRAIGSLSENADTMIDTLQRNTFRHLRPQLTKSDPASRAVSLATTRVLCQAQIYGANPEWRVHLNGARAILQSGHGQHGGTQPCSDSPETFLSSWYDNAEALAALTPMGLLDGQLERTVTAGSCATFDVFGGVMSDLPDLFREVGALVRESHSRANAQPSILTESDIILEAETLTLEIHRRLQRDAVETLSLDPQLLLGFSSDVIQDYALSNAGFLYTALLHVYCGVLGLPSSAPEVQSCVEHIISCATNMTCSSGLSPRVLLVAPLFHAGLCAVGSAREGILSALTDIKKWMRTPHLSNLLGILEQSWQKPIDGPRHDWPDRVNFDILPY